MQRAVNPPTKVYGGSNPSLPNSRFDKEQDTLDNIIIFCKVGFVTLNGWVLVGI